MASWGTGIGVGGADECSIWVTTEDHQEGKRMNLTAITESVPPEFVCLGVEGVIRENDPKITRLLALLNEDRYWHNISCYEGFVEFFLDEHQNAEDEDEPPWASQAYLSVLNAAMRRTKHFMLDIFHTDEAVYQCLMAALSSPNGMMEELHISHSNPRQGFNQVHARLLADGLALATSLRKLKLSLTDFFSFLQPVEGRLRMIGDTLLHGIQRNTSIMDLDLEIDDIVDVGFVSQLAETLLSRPKGLQSLRIANHKFTEADLGNLKRYLGQEDCTLRELALNNTSSLEEPAILFEDLENKTVHTLNLSGAELSSDSLVLLPFAFPNLSVLDLSHNFIDNLSFLDPLLCENSTVLETLHLQHNPIWKASMIEFADKLPSMRGLRSLSLFENKFLESPSAVDALLDNILKNRSLENFHVTQFRHEKAGLVLHCLNLNKGGRRGIDLDSASSTIDRKLWPLVFHRCLVVQEYQCIKNTGYTFRGTDTRIQADIVFWLLRHRFMLS